MGWKAQSNGERDDQIYIYMNRFLHMTPQLKKAITEHLCEACCIFFHKGKWSSRLVGTITIGNLRINTLPHQKSQAPTNTFHLKTTHPYMYH